MKAPKKIDLPSGWTARGALPSLGGKLGEKQLLQLTEDLWSATSPDGRFSLDVGWYPHGSAEGAFRATLVVDGDWESAPETITTRDAGLVREWLRAAVVWCQANSLDATLDPATLANPTETVRFELSVSPELSEALKHLRPLEKSQVRAA